jgi:pimeloyl-ACP methyl ester carboxylesterase
MTRRDAIVAGRRITCFDVGAGRPLVLLHAFPLHAGMWAPQLAAVPPGWRYVAPDLRGFGPEGATPATDSAAGPSIDDHAVDVAGLIEELGLGRIVLAGLSMGGYVAFALLRRAAHLVRALVLANTRADADSPDGRAGRDRMIALVEREGIEPLVREVLPRLLASPAGAAGDRVRALIRENRPVAITQALRALTTRPDSTPLLDAIGVPTLVIGGASDAITPPAETEGLARGIPGATFEIIEGAGHLSSIERPDAFNRVLIRFLAGLEE